MDFKAIINKIASMDDAIDAVKSPELPKAVQLNEDAELRVLSGRTTYVAEAKKKAEEEKVDEEMKVGEKKKSSTGGTIEKTKTGVKHTAGKNYGGETAEKEDKKKSKKDESIDVEAFKGKFAQMVEAKKKAKPDFADIDGDGDTKEPMKKAAADKKKEDGKKGMSDKQAKYFGKKKDVKEAEEKRAPAKKAEREVELPSGAKVKATKVQGWQSQKADKESNVKESQIDELSSDTMKSYKAKTDKDMYKGVDSSLKGKDRDRAQQKSANRTVGRDRADSKIIKKDLDGAFEGKKSYKKTVKESVEPKLSFRDMMKLVVESGGQQQIDPVDQELFAWASRIAKSKLGEGMKAEVYAGMVYERMGGVFEMYDVLSEDKK